MKYTTHQLVPRHTVYWEISFGTKEYILCTHALIFQPCNESLNQCVNSWIYLRNYTKYEAGFAVLPVYDLR